MFNSAVVCVFLDADALAVLKESYSLLGEVLGKYTPNKTIEKYLKRQRLSIVEFRRTANGRTHVNIVPPLVPTLHPGASLLVPAPAAVPQMETPQADPSELGSAAHLVEEYRDVNREDIGRCGMDVDANSGGLGANCPPFDLGAGLPSP